MEGLVSPLPGRGASNLYNAVFQGKRVFLTGHTGFKGSWLALWLQLLGARVTGFSLDPPSEPSHYPLLDLDLPARRGDLRDFEQLRVAILAADPEIVFHLAAQPLVRRSHAAPVETFATNVMGTAHLLEACRMAPSLRAVVVVTSDKCYENQETGRLFREGDPLGGGDPYSASKGCAELVTASFRRSFFAAPGQALVASVRAGNAIGGGDWGEDRLLPDLARAAQAGETALLRRPGAVRPWQHVLEPLSGYLRVGQLLLEGRARVARGWNFGPAGEAALTVAQVAERFAAGWPRLRVREAPEPGPLEAGFLGLDCGQAARRLAWRPVWDTARAVAETVAWYRAYYEERRVLTAAQLTAYLRDAAAAGLAWTREGGPA